MSRKARNSPEEVARLSNKLLKTFCAAWLGLTFAACGTTDQQVGSDELMTSAEAKDGSALQQALSAVPGARVIDTHKDGTPSFISGSFGKTTRPALGLAAVDAKATVQASLSTVAPMFGLRADDLVFRSMTVDADGSQHMRFNQTKNGLLVVNGQLILHTDKAGNVILANGDARDSQNGMAQGMVKTVIAADAAAAMARNATNAIEKSAKAERVVYVRGSDDKLILAHEIRVVGMGGDGLPVNDLVYVNAANGAIALKSPQIMSAKNREVHNLNHATALPGPLSRTETQAAVGEQSVDMNHALLGTVWDCYKTLFNRDSFDNAGAKLISSVHYSNNYVNAYWDSTQMVYGDGDNSTSINLSWSMDVTAHELTHAVTERTAGLNYSGESGGLNESMSDVMGGVCESFRVGGAALPIDGTYADPWRGNIAYKTFYVGEDIWTPGTAGDALRYMDDPARDGSSADFYSSSVGNLDVHYSSGLGNLAFKLLAAGGTHPRGKSTTVVTGIGLSKAAQVWYKALTGYMTATTNYAAAKTATESAAAALVTAGTITSTDAASVTAAWTAIGVGVTQPPPTVVTLSNGVAVTGQGAATGAALYYKLTVPAGQASVVFASSGGTGDADLYTNFGAVPTTSTYTCRPFASGNAETCTTTNPAAGDYYVMLNAYATFSGVSLTGTYSTGGGGGGTVLTNGVATAAYSGSANVMKCFTLTVPSGKTSLVFNQVGLTGTTGDADLYVRSGAAPTTSTYTCRPYLSGNTETCTISAPAAGTWYACSNGFSAYTNVTMKGTYTP
jgi:Zn-dependent metalloprotease